MSLTNRPAVLAAVGLSVLLAACSRSPSEVVPASAPVAAVGPAPARAPASAPASGDVPAQPTAEPSQPAGTVAVGVPPAAADPSADPSADPGTTVTETVTRTVTTTVTAPPRAPSGPADTQVKEGKALIRKRLPAMGEVVTDQDGWVLYRFDKDTAQPSASRCSGPCAVTWPPVTASGPPRLEGISAGVVGEVRRADGTRQLTIGGWPVYRYAKDVKPGQWKGQGVGGTWFAVTGDGRRNLSCLPESASPGASRGGPPTSPGAGGASPAAARSAGGAGISSESGY